MDFLHEVAPHDGGCRALQRNIIGERMPGLPKG